MGEISSLFIATTVLGLGGLGLGGYYATRPVSPTAAPVEEKE